MRPCSTSRPGVKTSLEVVSLALVSGLVIPRLPRRAHAIANLGVAATAVIAPLRNGVSPEDLGLEPKQAVRGVLYGIGAAIPLAAVIVVGARSERLQDAFVDPRVTSVHGGHAAREVLLRIPFVTAAPEELLFRGGVLGAVTAATNRRLGVVLSSFAFGVWHVLPAVEAYHHGATGSELTRRGGGRPAHVGATVLATTAAGVALAALRLRARSVFAPLIVHAAVNATAYLATRSANASNRRGAGTPIDATGRGEVL
jgi:membrane protease YdiL (CAAX protease family)